MAITVQMYSLGEIFQKAQKYAELTCEKAKVEDVQVGPGDDGKTHIFVDYQDIDTKKRYAGTFTLQGP
jgi:hypothetical protein